MPPNIGRYLVSPKLSTASVLGAHTMCHELSVVVYSVAITFKVRVSVPVPVTEAPWTSSLATTESAFEVSSNTPVAPAVTDTVNAPAEPFKSLRKVVVVVRAFAETYTYKFSHVPAELTSNCLREALEPPWVVPVETPKYRVTEAVATEFEPLIAHCIVVFVVAANTHAIMGIANIVPPAPITYW